MIVAQLLDRERQHKGFTQAEFLAAAKMSQSSWSRINRGRSFFTLEELRLACQAVGAQLSTVIVRADELARLLPKKEKIEVVERKTGGEKNSILPTVIASAALAFLIARLLQSK